VDAFGEFPPRHASPCRGMVALSAQTGIFSLIVSLGGANSNVGRSEGVDRSREATPWRDRSDSFWASIMGVDGSRCDSGAVAPL